MPAELKLNIYRNVFQADDNCSVTHRITNQIEYRTETLKAELVHATDHRNILMTCRSCWYEGVDTYYENTSIVLQGTGWMRWRIDMHLPERMLQHVAHLCLPGMPPHCSILNLGSPFYKLETIQTKELTLRGRRKAKHVNMTAARIFWNYFAREFLYYTVIRYRREGGCSVRLTCPVTYHYRTGMRRNGELSETTVSIFALNMHVTWLTGSYCSTPLSSTS